MTPRPNTLYCKLGCLSLSASSLLTCPGWESRPIVMRPLVQLQRSLSHTRPTTTTRRRHHQGGPKGNLTNGFLAWTWSRQTNGHSFHIQTIRNVRITNSHGRNLTNNIDGGGFDRLAAHPQMMPMMIVSMILV